LKAWRSLVGVCEFDGVLNASMRKGGDSTIQ